MDTVIPMIQVGSRFKGLRHANGLSPNDELKIRNVELYHFSNRNPSTGVVVEIQNLDTGEVMHFDPAHIFLWLDRGYIKGVD